MRVQRLKISSHIVPRESILPIALPFGPSGLSFDFSYGSRGSPKMMEELGLLLCNLTTVVPEGIVVFFSSFEYEAKVYDAWKVSGILQRISRKKRLFREPRSNTEIDTLLKDYKETIDKLSRRDPKEGQPSQNGAVLLAVVGGKISEGINFSDGMGRCIVMIPVSPLKLLLASCDVSCDAQSGFEVLRCCKTKGREYYENLCMKAVNQSIGRAIRHINDYAAIVLVDSGYACDPSKGNSSHPVNKLPQWIRDCLVPATGGYGEVHRQLHQFFRYNRQKATETIKGNFDLVGNNFPVFFIRDGMKFPDMVHALKPNPKSHIQENWRILDFFSHHPESLNMFTFLFDDIEIPQDYRHMDGSGVNTYTLINKAGKVHYVKFHWKPTCGLESNLCWRMKQ